MSLQEKTVLYHTLYFYVCCKGLNAIEGKFDFVKINCDCILN